MSATKVALICGHRYGRRLARAILESPLDFVHAFVLHPRNWHRYGGYESPLSTLEAGGVGITYFDEVSSLESRQHWRRVDPHYVLVCGLRQLLPLDMLWRVARNNAQPTLSSKGSGFVCFHPSNLPDGAGMAPVQWTLFEKSPEGTVTSFFIDDGGIDSGPVIAKRTFPILAGDDAHDLDRKIGDEIAAGFADIVPALAARAVPSIPQIQLPITRRVRPQIDAKERWIDFKDPVEKVALQVRAFTKPYGGTAALIGDKAILVYGCAVEPAQLRVGEYRESPDGLIVGCADGAIRITAYAEL